MPTSLGNEPEVSSQSQSTSIGPALADSYYQETVAGRSSPIRGWPTSKQNPRPLAGASLYNAASHGGLGLTYRRIRSHTADCDVYPNLARKSVGPKAPRATNVIARVNAMA